MSQFGRIGFGLGVDIAWHERPFRRVISSAGDTERIFKLHLSLDKVRQ